MKKNFERVMEIGDKALEAGDIQTALDTYLKAAEADYIPAMKAVQQIYEGLHDKAFEDFDDAFKWEMAAANLGDPEAICGIGRSYEYGIPVDEDMEEAKKWYAKAAELGYPEAMNKLGVLSDKPDEAFAWYAKAADTGYDVAICNVGLCYFYGDGVEKNKEKAKELFHEAADKGNYHAMTMLGECYRHGYACAVDYAKAVEWYNKAIEDESEYMAFNGLGILYDDGRGIERDSTQAIVYFERAAELGLAPAMGNLAASYYDIGDKELAMYWAEKALEGDEENPFALNILADVNILDDCVSPNHEKGIQLLQKAADLGNIRAMRNLGLCYKNGLAAEVNYYLAEKWLQEAAKRGDAEAMDVLGDMYRFGNIKQDYAKAVQWYQKAVAEKNYVSSLHSLGTMYREGLHFPQDTEVAIDYFEKAAEQGMAEAMEDLTCLYDEVEDYDKAAYWAQKALEADENNTVLILLGYYYLEGSGVEKDIEKGLELLHRAASLDSIGLCHLGHVYRNGVGVEADIQEAINWYRRAAIKGNKDGMILLGHMLRRGETGIENYAEAMKWYQRANEGEPNAEALNSMGIMYNHGLGVETDIDKAIDLYEQAVELGLMAAMGNLAGLYDEMEQYELAVEWAQKALEADENDDDMLYLLGVCYLTGHGVEIDEEKGESMVIKAAELGNEEAKELLNNN